VITSAIGLEQGLVSYIDNQQAQYETAVKDALTPRPFQDSSGKSNDSQLYTVLEECQEYLQVF
jgi:hypothetical protein